MTNTKRNLVALALVGLGVVAGAVAPTGAQVANGDQRVIRAMEKQATSLAQIARSVASIERKIGR